MWCGMIPAVKRCTSVTQSTATEELALLAKSLMSWAMVVLPAPLSPVRISLVNVCTGKSLLQSMKG